MRHQIIIGTLLVIAAAIAGETQLNSRGLELKSTSGFLNNADIAAHIHFSAGNQLLPSRPKLLDSYLAPVMQALAYHIELLQYEPLAGTTIEPPFQGAESLGASSTTPYPISSSITQTPSTTVNVWWQPSTTKKPEILLTTQKPTSMPWWQKPTTTSSATIVIQKPGEISTSSTQKPSSSVWWKPTSVTTTTPSQPWWQVNGTSTATISTTSTPWWQTSTSTKGPPNASIPWWQSSTTHLSTSTSKTSATWWPTTPKPVRTTTPTTRKPWWQVTTTGKPPTSAIWWGLTNGKPSSSWVQVQSTSTKPPSSTLWWQTSSKPSFTKPTSSAPWQSTAEPIHFSSTQKPWWLQFSTTTATKKPWWGSRPGEIFPSTTSTKKPLTGWWSSTKTTQNWWNSSRPSTQWWQQSTTKRPSVQVSWQSTQKPWWQASSSVDKPWWYTTTTRKPITSIWWNSPSFVASNNKPVSKPTLYTTNGVGLVETTPFHFPGNFAPAQSHNALLNEYLTQSVDDTDNDAEGNEVYTITAAPPLTTRKESSTTRKDSNWPFDTPSLAADTNFLDWLLQGKSKVIPNDIEYDFSMLDPYPGNLIHDILKEKSELPALRDIDNVNEFLKVYDDSYGRYHPISGKKRIPPTKPYVEFLMLYDLLKREAKSLNLTIYEGYSEKMIEELSATSKRSAEIQLHILMTRMLEQKEVKRNDVTSRIKSIIKDLENPGSTTARALHVIPPIQFVP